MHELASPGRLGAHTCSRAQPPRIRSAPGSHACTSSCQPGAALVGFCADGAQLGVPTGTRSFSPALAPVKLLADISSEHGEVRSYTSVAPPHAGSVVASMFTKVAQPGVIGVQLHAEHVAAGAFTVVPPRAACSPYAPSQ